MTSTQQPVARLTENNYADICHQVADAEPAFARVRMAYGLPPFWHRPEGMETLVRIILEQQVSLASGRAHYERLHQYTEGLQLPILLQMPDEAYRNCHISRQKTGYIRHLAQQVQSGQLDLISLPTLPNDAIVAQLCSVKGIGPWTAAVYLMMCLHRPDYFPPGDIAAMHAAHELFPDMALLQGKALAAAAVRWSPYRTVATNYLWWWYLKGKDGV